MDPKLANVLPRKSETFEFPADFRLCLAFLVSGPSRGGRIGRGEVVAVAALDVVAAVVAGSCYESCGDRCFFTGCGDRWWGSFSLWSW